MNLIQVFHRFPTQEACIEHLEKVRWNDNPACPHCQSEHVARKADGDRVGRWNCHACKSSFNVLSGTIFQQTRQPLQKWFLGISLILNAKKSLSAHQLARDLDLTVPTAWRMAHQIRKAMNDSDAEMLSGIVEADEAYIGGKPRKHNHRDKNTPPPAKRGRGTRKLPIIGAVERGGRVVAKPSISVNMAALTDFLTQNVEPEALLITDEYGGYNAMHRRMRHATIDHSVRYADGIVHTNTIEGFWSNLKRAWYGQHHHYSRKFAPLYVIESCYKYNIRKSTDAFGSFLRSVVLA